MGKMENKDRGNDGRKAHYCVLYTQALRQCKVNRAVQIALPQGEGEVFYPCREMWWNGIGGTVFRPIFPGYLFLRSELDRARLHGAVLRARGQILSFVKELWVSRMRDAGEDAPLGDLGFTDLTDEEAELFDLLLGFRFDAELDARRKKAAKEGLLYMPTWDCGQFGKAAGDVGAPGMISDDEKAIIAELRRRRKQPPPKGVVQMSFGYMEGGRYVIMDGPLKGHEDHIRDYIAKDRKVCLDMGIGGKPAKVGLTLLGKKVWFPKDKESPDTLPDGTVLDTRGLARAMMGGK